MKKYGLLLILCSSFCLVGCSLSQQAPIVQQLVDSRQTEVTIVPSNTTLTPMSGCSRYRYMDSGYAVEFRSQICTGNTTAQLYPVTDGYAIQTDTGLSEPVIRFFHKDIANNIELAISDTLNKTLTGEASLGCIVAVSDLQKKRQWEIFRYGVVPFGTYAETVLATQKINPLYSGCGVFDGSQEPYGYFEYHTGSTMYMFVQLSATGTLFDPDSFTMRR